MTGCWDRKAKMDVSREYQFTCTMDTINLLFKYQKIIQEEKRERNERVRRSRGGEMTTTTLVTKMIVTVFSRHYEHVK